MTEKEINETTIQNLINRKAVLNRWFGKHKLTITEQYREKFILLVDAENNETIEQTKYVLEEWKKQEIKNLEDENAKKGISNINTYFEKYGILNEKKSYDQSKFEYPSEYASDGFNSCIVYNGFPSNAHGVWNSTILFRTVRVERTKNINNYFRKYGKISEVEINIDNKDEYCIDCKIVEGEPTLRHSHGWYDNIHKEMTNHYPLEDFNQDLNHAFDLFVEYTTEEIKKYFDITQPFLKQGDKLYQDNAKAILIYTTHKLYASEVFDTNKYRKVHDSHDMAKVPSKFKETLTFEELQAYWKENYYTLIKLRGYDNIKIPKNTK